MSLRYKQILIMFILLIINLTTLLSYYELYLSSEMNNVLRETQERLEEAAQEVVVMLEESENMLYTMEHIDSQTDYMFTVYDIDGNVLYESKELTDYTFYSSTHFQKDGEIYRLKIASLEEMRNPLAMEVPRKLVKFQIGSICLTLLIYSAIIHIVQIKPLLKLSADMESFRYGKVVETTKSNDEIGKCRNNFAALTRRLEREKNVQNEIIASISHDIKTPLTSVMGYAERLKKKKFSEERTQKYLDTIYSKSLAIKELVEEFDDYLGCNIRTTLKLQITSVKDLEEMLINEYQDELHSKGIEFEIEKKCGDNIEFAIDMPKMRRVFGNIIGNSLKFFSDEKPRIGVTISEESKEIVLNIEDNGIGVKEEELESIFTPLYTSDASRSVAGLGLAICKQIVEAHDGKIKAKNINKGGLNIEIRLPEYVHTLLEK